VKGLRFQKRIPLGKGVRLNLSKSGVGISAGVKGFRVGVGPRGGTVRASLPGTGIGYEYRTKKGRRRERAATAADTSALQPAASQVERRAAREEEQGHPWVWILAGIIASLATGSAWWLLLTAWGLVILFRRRGQ